MTIIHWKEEIEKRKEQLLEDTKGLLTIPSLLDESNGKEGAPFGPEIEKALSYMLTLGEKSGMTIKNVDGYAGHLEMGSGEELIGILCHVDVVPPGEGWSFDPFGAEIKDGKIYARGAIDDKGPTMAAFYAMKIIQELKLPLSKRVRMIIGCDEESNWQCVRHYFNKEEMPDYGFAPDADFPIINAEKGIFDVQFTLDSNNHDIGEIQLVSFQSGQRLNMVPDRAIAKISGRSLAELEKEFKLFAKTKNMDCRTILEEEVLTIQAEGKSAHGSTPEIGINAGLMLAEFLKGFSFTGQEKKFLTLLDQASGEFSGKKLGIAAEDKESGSLTVNVGVMNYSCQGGGKVGMNIRYPVTHNSEQIEAVLTKKAESDTWKIKIIENNPPNFVDENHPMIKTLQKVYKEQTGEEGELIAIGGGTYARSLTTGVAFGALFPGREDVAHQKDEYMHVDDLLQAAAIYAQAIYELAK
ncbi:dipeptidase PepV [Fictibacillus nanhaiensis]|uniref:dipeptidase PepV n=1 Tax=Fictibacillus nanhaiensis TaxID=742169 RepID=UPI001C93CD11|nr:dipeptidase PepV [Fictibacillus nanhaiensis]MBY6035128.1 dipeptidase PepV [Fictibacillus nanhaiensis]